MRIGGRWVLRERCGRWCIDRFEGLCRKFFKSRKFVFKSWGEWIERVTVGSGYVLWMGVLIVWFDFSFAR